MKYFLFGLIANAASVVQHQLGVLRPGDLLVTLFEQRTHDFFRIVGIHLAAESLDVEGLHTAVQQPHEPPDAKQRRHKAAKTIRAVFQASFIRSLRDQPQEDAAHEREQYATFRSDPGSNS